MKEGKRTLQLSWPSVQRVNLQKAEVVSGRSTLAAKGDKRVHSLVFNMVISCGAHHALLTVYFSRFRTGEQFNTIL